MPIQGFPAGNARMASGAFIIFMILMGKIVNFPQPFSFANCFTRIIEMAKCAIAFFSAAKVTLKTNFFWRSAEAVRNVFFRIPHTFIVLANNIGLTQWLPTGR
jgi:hypothetical protein